ncbi:MAG: dUTP diphosphatase [Planctomycetes bacterium]|nr:dUTP diphosphatase [Planctomycetota bacterium]
MTLTITRIDKTMPMPQYETPGSCAFDIYAREETVVPPKEIALIPTNLIVCVPKGFVFLLISRSSTPGRTGLSVANGIGVVDQDFCGPEDEMRAIMYNPTEEPVTIAKGFKFVQGLLMPVEKPELVEGDPASNTSRVGIGSTNT